MSKFKKILILTQEYPPFYGGIGTYARNMSLIASELNYSVKVLAPAYSQTPGKFMENENLIIIRFKGKHYNIFQLPRYICRITKILKKETFDIIHAIDLPNAICLNFISNKILKKSKLITTVYGTDILGFKKSFHIRFFNLYKMYNKFDTILAISKYTKDLFLNYILLEDHLKIKYVYLGVGKEYFIKCNFSLKKEIEEKIQNNFVILTVSRIDERKGHENVLKALSRIDINKYNYLYVIVGDYKDNDYFDKLKQIIDEYNLNVIFTGKISFQEIIYWYNKADVFCMPGKSMDDKVEGFGLVYLEAAAQKTPSIGSTVGAVPEVVINNETGLLVEDGNIDALKNAIVYLMKNEKARAILANNAHKRAEEFTWQRTVLESYG